MAEVVGNDMVGGLSTESAQGPRDKRPALVDWVAVTEWLISAVILAKGHPEPAPAHQATDADTPWGGALKSRGTLVLIDIDDTKQLVEIQDVPMIV
jgi:hypothetical protein